MRVVAIRTRADCRWKMLLQIMLAGEGSGMLCMTADAELLRRHGEPRRCRNRAGGRWCLACRLPAAEKTLGLAQAVATSAFACSKRAMLPIRRNKFLRLLLLSRLLGIWRCLLRVNPIRHLLVMQWRNARENNGLHPVAGLGAATKDDTSHSNGKREHDQQTPYRASQYRPLIVVMLRHFLTSALPFLYCATGAPAIALFSTYSPKA